MNYGRLIKQISGCVENSCFNFVAEYAFFGKMRSNMSSQMHVFDFDVLPSPKGRGRRLAKENQASIWSFPNSK